MSTISPRLIHNDVATDNALNDPYLAAPSDDDDEASFRSTGIRYTPVNDDDQPTSHNASASPLEFSTNNASTPGNNEDYTSYPLFSPTTAFTDDPSAHASPTTDVMAAGIWPQHNGVTANTMQDPTSGRFVSMSTEMPSPQAAVDPSQLLTPILSNNSSPSSETNSAKNKRNIRLAPHLQPLTLITTPPNDSLNVYAAPDSARAISPIVKVESFSRGDSPVRDISSMNRRPSQSLAHLSPGGMSNGPEENDGLEDDHSITRGNNGSWIPSKRTGQAGVAPSARGNVFIASPNEVDMNRQLEEKNADIWTWSEAVSEANSEAGDNPRQSRGRTNIKGARPRAKSAGYPSHQQDYFNLKCSENMLSIPGPGLLLYEPSDLSEEESESPVSVERIIQEGSDISPPPEHHPSEEEEQLPSQFISPQHWQSHEHNSSLETTRSQPETSAAAMMEYQRRARDFDTISRWATWGTREGVESLKNLSLEEKKKNEKIGGIFRRITLTKKQPNNLKRAHQSTDLSATQASVQGADKGDESKPTPQRKDSFPRKLSLSSFSPKSPRGLSTEGAVIAITKQMAAIGGNKNSLQVASPTSPSKPWPNFRRTRSRSELPRAYGIVDLMSNHGGPPAPIISLPANNDEPPPSKPGLSHDACDDDDDEDLDDDKGLVMNFPINSILPVPTLEGFRNQIIQLNPRLDPGLLDRFAQEQLRRYKKLVEAKQNHAHAVGQKRCASKKYCFAQGGQARFISPQAPTQETEIAHTQFQIAGRGEHGSTSQSFGEATSATAQFPHGVPLPPPQVTKLPAEFECPVCFQAKKFHKPSDWTKHIYEDVQPFTCTFPDCSDPKSFKRKADWVRHESERHRQLEWWECNFPDCRHKCYRKDNFVQHLVREHKLPEPKVKKTKTKPPSPTHEGIPHEPEANQRLWDLVEECRYVATKEPQEEPCRFCGNVCNTWKKLTVHLAKHMEQIAIPILRLVDQREFQPANINASPRRADPCSDQMPIVHEVSGYASRIDGVPDGPNSSMNFTQAQYPSHHAEIPLQHPTYATSISLQSGSLVSAEPKPMSPPEHMPLNPQAGLQGHPALSGPQMRLMPGHLNSVSYPPSNPATSNHSMRVLQDFHTFSTSPTEMHFDPQNTVYVSSSVENNFTYPGSMIPPALPYNPPGGYPQ